MKFSYIDMLKWDTGYASPKELRTGSLERDCLERDCPLNTIC
jgi:hypothetical protein